MADQHRRLDRMAAVYAKKANAERAADERADRVRLQASNCPKLTEWEAPQHTCNDSVLDLGTRSYQIVQ